MKRIDDDWEIRHFDKFLKKEFDLNYEKFRQVENRRLIIYSIIFYLYKKNGFLLESNLRSTKIMYNIHLCPTHYKDIRNAIKDLIEEGVIETRKVKNDKKGYYFYLTPSGVKIVDKIIKLCKNGNF